MPGRWIAMPRDDQSLGEFIDAAVDDHPKAKSMLAACPGLRDRGWLHGETALHFLAIENYIEGVRFCCENGFDVNATNEFGDTALIDVMTLGRLELVNLLLEHGADPNAKSRTRISALHTAVGSGDVELVRRMLAAGARPDNAASVTELLYELPEDEPARSEIIKVLRDFGFEQEEQE
ncbi:MAG: ankyrin repeat domain-containing protein [Phycisphaerae bacterium]